LANGANNEAPHVISPVISSFLGSNILLSTVFSNTLHLCTADRAREQLRKHNYTKFKGLTLNGIVTMLWAE